jgi:hypothetical protein
MTYQTFSKRNRVIIDQRCPYCRGELQRTSHYYWDYDCCDCDRGWKVFGNTWTALFDAANTVVVIKPKERSDNYAKKIYCNGRTTY